MSEAVTVENERKPTRADLDYCVRYLQPKAIGLLAEQTRCIGVPWRYRRWRRAYKAHKAVNAQWARILAGAEHAREHEAGHRAP